MTRQKYPYWRSKEHLRNVASLPCQLCGIHGLTQASHSNSSIHGKANLENSLTKNQYSL